MDIAIGPPGFVTLENLLRIKQKNIKEFEHKAREIAYSAIQHKKIYIVYRIAKELQDLYCDVEDIEDFIISFGDPFYIYKFAREIKSANIIRLQEAIINTHNYNYIAKFACFVNGADTELIENLIIQSNNARAAYIYLRFGKHPNIHKFKHIFIKSKKPRYLYGLAQVLTDPIELELIEKLIIEGKSNMYVRLFAANIPGANIQKLENRILATRNMTEIKKFARSIKSEKLNKLIMLM